MPQINLTRHIYADRVPADPSMLAMADPTSTQGVWDADTGDSLVEAFTEWTRTAKGVYTFTIPNAANGPVYRYWIRTTLAGQEPFYTPQQVTAGQDPSFPDVDDLDVVESSTATNADGCEVLTRVNAFVVQAATSPVLQFTFRDRAGRPVSLLPANAEAITDAEQVIVRFRELDYEAFDCQDTAFNVEAQITDAAEGVVRVIVPSPVVRSPGLHRVEFGFQRRGEMKLIGRTLLSVEATGFAASPSEGAPTIGEIRGQMMDFAADNLRLENVEFSDEQIIDALRWPIQDFNEKSPYLHQQFNTRTFKWRAQWIDAAVGRLYQYAAAWYRRNKIGGQGGGLALNELDRDVPYAQASQAMLQQWNQFRDSKKVELNAQGWIGSISGW